MGAKTQALPHIGEARSPTMAGRPQGVAQAAAERWEESA